MKREKRSGEGAENVVVLDGDLGTGSDVGDSACSDESQFGIREDSILESEDGSGCQLQRQRGEGRECDVCALTMIMSIAAPVAGFVLMVEIWLDFGSNMGRPPGRQASSRV